LIQNKSIQIENKNIKVEDITNKEKLKRIYSVMIPILITQLATMGMTVVDTMMSGHAGASNLAGVAIGSSLWLPILHASTGIISASTPIIAQHFGASRHEDIAPSVRHGTYVAIALALIIIILGVFFSDNLLLRLDLTPSVYNVAIGYLGGLAVGILPLFININLRSFVDTMGLTSLTMKLFLLALPVNAFFNYCLIFGELGFPKLGGIGAGWATSLTEFVLLAAFLLAINKVKVLKKYKIFATLGNLETKRLFEQLKIGVPSGISIFFETSVFSWIAFAIAKFGTSNIASAQIALNIGGVLYMFPLSMSFALVIIVGYKVGAKEHKEAQKYANIGIINTIIIVLSTILVIVLNNYFIVSLYSANSEIIKISSTLIVLIACYQPFDAIGVPIQGILRGYKDIKFPFYAAFCSYWLICVPTSCLLDYKFNYGVQSYFYGLMMGVLANSVLLFLRFNYIKSKYKSLYNKQYFNK
jgi:MATE family multidrug resistance protein